MGRKNRKEELRRKEHRRQQRALRAAQRKDTGDVINGAADVGGSIAKEGSEDIKGGTPVRGREGAAEKIEVGDGGEGTTQHGDSTTCSSSLNPNGDNTSNNNRFANGKDSKHHVYGRKNRGARPLFPSTIPPFLASTTDNENCCMSWLPVELLIHVLDNVTPDCIINLSLTCRTWAEILADDSVWRHCHLNLHFGGQRPRPVVTEDGEVPPMITWRKHFIASVTKHRSIWNPYSPQSPYYFQEVLLWVISQGHHLLYWKVRNNVSSKWWESHITGADSLLLRACSSGSCEMFHIIKDELFSTEAWITGFRLRTSFRSLLTAATKSGNIDLVRTILEMPIGHLTNDVNRVYDWGQLPLAPAIQYGWSDIVELLLADKRTTVDASVMDEAVKRGDVALYERLSAMRPLEMTLSATGFWIYYTSLISAIKYKRLEMFKVLLARQLPSTIERDRFTTALAAAAEVEHEEIARILVEAGAEDANSSTTSAIQIAISKHNAPLVKIIIKARMAKEPRPYGQRPDILHAIECDSNLEILQLILERDREKCSSTHNAAIAKFAFAAAARKGNLEATRLIFQFWSDIVTQKEFVSFLSNDGCTPLHLACRGVDGRSQNPETIDFLVQLGSDLKQPVQPNTSGYLPVSASSGPMGPLLLAAKYGNKDTFNHLITRYPKEFDDQLYEAFLVAIKERRVGMIRHLMNKEEVLRSLRERQDTYRLMKVLVHQNEPVLDLVTLLLDNGILDVNCLVKPATAIRTERKFFPLLLAVKSRAKYADGVACLLLSRGADCQCLERLRQVQGELLRRGLCTQGKKKKLRNRLVEYLRSYRMEDSQPREGSSPTQSQVQE